MARWLFNSAGRNVAFVSGASVFTKSGRLIGELDGNEIWNGSYVGEIMDDDRLARKRLAPIGLRGLLGPPRLPGLPGLHGLRSAVRYPAMYQDVDLPQ